MIQYVPMRYAKEQTQSAAYNTAYSVYILYHISLLLQTLPILFNSAQHDFVSNSAKAVAQSIHPWKNKHSLTQCETLLPNRKH